MAESAYKSFEISPGGQLKRLGSDSTSIDAANNARQTFPKTYIPNGYVDVLSTAFIRESGLLHGDHVIPFFTPTVAEIDTEDDFVFLEYQLSRTPAISTYFFG
jgi:N-acylneuraminate cytidylyltransferase